MIHTLKSNTYNTVNYHQGTFISRFFLILTLHSFDLFFEIMCVAFSVSSILHVVHRVMYFITIIMHIQSVRQTNRK